MVIFYKKKRLNIIREKKIGEKYGCNKTGNDFEVEKLCYDSI